MAAACPAATTARVGGPCHLWKRSERISSSIVAGSRATLPSSPFRGRRPVLHDTKARASELQQAPERGVVHEFVVPQGYALLCVGYPSSDIEVETQDEDEVRNDKARKYLTCMRRKQSVSFSQKFPKADPLALQLLRRLLAFDPKDRPSAEEALADPYFNGLAKVEREPSCQPIPKIEFEFERCRVSKEDIKELIFQEILE